MLFNEKSLINGLNDSYARANYEYMVDIAVVFGAERDRAENEMYDVLDFIVNLAEVSIDLNF